MDDMREIVTVEQIQSLFVVVAIAAPFTGALVGAVLGRRQRGAARGAVLGGIAGLLGPANLLLWWVYNRITDRLGLDSVRNLLVNLALFAALGVVAGLALAYLRRDRTAA